MIEAVNSVLQTAPFVRSSNEQVSTVDSFAANPERVQKAPQAPFVSPYIYLDVNYDKAVIQLRNGETGDVEDQYPSSTQLEAQARSAARRASQQEASRKEVADAAPHVPVAEGKPAGAGDGANDAAVAAKAASLTAQHQAAFAAAAQSGNSNAGNVTVFA